MNNMTCLNEDLCRKCAKIFAKEWAKVHRTDRCTIDTY